MKRLISINTLFILCSILINSALLTNALAASPPIILITSPSDGAILGTGSITVTGTASDPTGIQKVEVSVDGSVFSLATGTISWSFTTGVLSSGPHTIVAKATNNAGITSVSVGINPQAVAVNPTTNTIYVTSYYDNPISVINGATNTVVSTIPSGSNAQQIAVNPSTNTIYVANFESDSISVINGIKNTVKSTIPGLNGPLGVAVNPTTNTIYASNYWSNSISVINGATNTLTSTISGIDSPSKIAVNPTTNTVYVSNQNSASVTAINGATNTVTSTISLLVGSHPAYITVNPSTNTIYVTNGNPADSISVINGATNTVTATIPVEIQPNGITVNPSTNTIYVTNLQSNSVSVIDGATNTVTATIPVEAYPNSVAVNPTTNTVYVSNQVSNSVSVINGITAIPETASTSVLFTIDSTTNPVANASLNQNVNGGDTITLDGSQSSDPDGNSLTYSWIQTSGPTVSIQNANTVNPTFNAPKPTASNQVLEFQLTVSDGINVSQPSSVIVTVKPHFPIILLPGVAGTSLYLGSNLSSENELWPVPSSSLSPMMMSMDGDGNSIGPVVTGPILDNNILFFFKDANIYGNMEKYLIETKGYTLGKDLFLFPYDWREANQNHWSDLDAVVDTALDSQTEPVPQTQVLLLAHSMGGLIAKSYLHSSLPHVQDVNATITVGTPYWGSVKGYYALVHGYTFENTLVEGGDEIFKCISQHIPSVYDLSPKQDFIKSGNVMLSPDTSFKTLKYGGVNTIKFKLAGLAEYGNGFGCPDFNSKAINWTPNYGLYDQSNLFYQNNFGTFVQPLQLSQQFKQYVIIGVGVQTLDSYQTKIVEKANHKNSILLDGNNVKLIPIVGDGDGTVPLWSSENVPDATHKYYIPYKKKMSSIHSDLPKNTDVITIIGSIIDGVPPLDSSYPNPNAPIKDLKKLGNISIYAIP